MIDLTQKIVGGRLKTMMADAAYCSILDLLGCTDRGVELLAPVRPLVHGKEEAGEDKPTDAA